MAMQRVNCLVQYSIESETWKDASDIAEKALKGIPGMTCQYMYTAGDEKFDKYLEEAREDALPNPIAHLRKSYGYSQPQFSDLFGIPLKTLRSWEQNLRTPPDYVYGMMRKILSAKHSDMDFKL